MDYIKAFIVGGIICAITQVLMEKTKLMPGLHNGYTCNIGYCTWSLWNI